MVEVIGVVGLFVMCVLVGNGLGGVEVGLFVEVGFV